MKKGIIVTSFGTTYQETRKLCIESIEERIKNEFNDYLVLRAFTSRIVISRIFKNENIKIDNPTEAMEKLKDQGIKHIYIQPLLIIEGIEYEKLLKEIRDFIKENSDCIVNIGKPLLSSDLDFRNVSKGLELSDENRAVVFMGHGSEHKADMAYEQLETVIRDKENNNIFIGTVEGEKSIEDILIELKEKHIDNVLLRPFMLVAGDHAINDMSSSEDDSWKSILEENGIKSTIDLKGLGEIGAIQDIFIQHLRDII